MGGLRDPLLGKQLPGTAEKPRRPLEYQVSAQSAPNYMTYPYVLGGYRYGGTTSELLRKGLVTWHTETINAHTVLLNAMLATAAFFWALQWAPDALPDGRWVCFLTLWLSILIHMPCSLGYHLLLPMDASCANLWRRLDICTIFVAAALLTYSMAALVLPRAATWALTAAAAGVAAAACRRTWQLRPEDRLADQKHSHTAFVGCGVALYSLPLAVHLARRLLYAGSLGLAGWCAAGALAALAWSAAVYAASWPERLAPGRFDLLGNSHQLMHVGVILAGACEFGFLVDLAWQSSAAAAAGSTGPAARAAL